VSKDKGKKRSASQRIGQIGEHSFEVWAVERHLAPQKATEDIGIDYFCQVLSPQNAVIENVTGAILAVSVRSVKGRRRRVKLSRADVVNILRTEAPCCLVGVNVEDKSIHYKFLDEDFIKQLYEFLDSGKDSMSLPIEEMDSDPAQFDATLTHIRRPVVQRTLLTRKAELGVNAAVPGGKLYLHHDSMGSLALVHAPWVTSMFEISREKQGEVSTQFFEKGMLPDRYEEGITLVREIEQLSDLAEKVLVAGAIQDEVEITIHSEDKSASSRFVVRRIGDETAYISEAGVVLVFSAARELEGQHVHQMRVSFIKDNVSDMSTEAVRSFVKLCNANAKFTLDGKPWLDIGLWPVLKNLGKAISEAEEVFTFLGLNFTGVHLKDLAEEEAMNTIAFLEALISGRHSGHIIPGFVLGPSAERKVEADDAGWRKGKYRIPVVANLLDKGIVVWIEGDCNVYTEDGLITGFRSQNITSWDYEWHDKRFEKSKEPEAWVHDEWPAIKIISAYDEKSFTFGSGIKHELGGDIWFDE